MGWAGDVASRARVRGASEVGEVEQDVCRGPFLAERISQLRYSHYGADALAHMYIGSVLSVFSSKPLLCSRAAWQSASTSAHNSLTRHPSRTPKYPKKKNRRFHSAPRLPDPNQPILGPRPPQHSTTPPFRPSNAPTSINTPNPTCTSSSISLFHSSLDFPIPPSPRPPRSRGLHPRLPHTTRLTASLRCKAHSAQRTARRYCTRSGSCGWARGRRV